MAWDPNPESNIAGYRIYYGVESSGVTNVIDVGRQTSGLVSGLECGQPYFFYVTAYNIFGLESDPSEKLTQEPVAIASSLITKASTAATLPLWITGDCADSVSVSWEKFQDGLLMDLGQGFGPPTLNLQTPGTYSVNFTVSFGDKVYTLNTRLMVVEEPAPDDPNPVISLQGAWVPFDDKLFLSWEAVSGAIYRLAFKRSLNEVYWTELVSTNANVRPGEAEVFKKDLDAISPAFFRVFKQP